MSNIQYKKLVINNAVLLFDKHLNKIFNNIEINKMLYTYKLCDKSKKNNTYQLKNIFFMHHYISQIKINDCNIKIINDESEYAYNNLNINIDNVDNKSKISIYNHKEIDFLCNLQYNKSELKIHFDIEHCALPLNLFVKEISPIHVSGKAYVSLNNNLQIIDFNNNIKQINKDISVYYNKSNVKIDNLLLKTYGSMQNMHVVSSFNAYNVKFCLDCKINHQSNNDIYTINLLSKIDGKLSIKDLKSAWPKNTAEGARTWITNNFHGGYVNRLSNRILLEIHDGNIDIKGTSGNIDITSVNISFLKNTPYIKSVCASSIYDDNKFDITIKSGNFSNQYIKTGKVFIYNLDKDIQTININLLMNGQLNNLLYTLNNRINIKEFLNIDKSNGYVNTSLNMSFPLLKDIFLKDIKMNLVNIITNSVLIIKQFNIKSDKITVEYINNNLLIKANSNIENLLFSWKLDKKYLEKLKFYANLYDDITNINKILKINNINKHINGKVKANIEYTIDKDYINLFLSFDEAKIKFPYIVLNKKLHKKFNISAKIFFKNNKRIIMDYTGEIFGKSNIELVSDQLSKIDITSNILALRYINNNKLEFLYLNAPKLQLRDDKGKSNNKQDIKKNLIYKDIRIKILCKSLLWKGNNISDININIFGKSQYDLFELNKIFFRDGIMSCNILNKKKNNILNMKINPVSNSETKIDITFNSLGQILKFFDIDKVYNGKGNITAIQNINGNYSGDININGLKATIPVMGKLISILSPMGIIDILSRDTLFYSIKSKFLYSDTKSILTIKNAIAKGINIGFHIDGDINITNKTVCLDLCVIPMYTLNTLLSNIPILGNFIIGDKGLFHLRFDLIGPYDNISVTLNPLMKFY